MVPATRRRRRGSVPAHPFDVLHGTDTGALIPGEELATGHRHDRFITAYHGVAPSLFGKVMARWRLLSRHAVQQTAFVDVGAGKGRAMLLAAAMPFRRIVGVELHPRLAAITRRNLEIWSGPASGSDHGGQDRWSTRSGAPIRIEEGDVMRLRMPAGPCCVFLFNPFDLVLMDRFLDRITRLFAGREGDLELLYVNDEQRDLLLQEHPRFQQQWRGRIFLSREDREADKAIITHCAEGMYVTTGYEDCSIWTLR